MGLATEYILLTVALVGGNPAEPLSAVYAPRAGETLTGTSSQETSALDDGKNGAPG